MRWGEQTELALRNFQVSGEAFPLEVVHEIAAIKAAALRANIALGVLDLEPHVCGVLIDAANEIASGLFDDEFRVDVFQTGSGTSTNMNVNEVIATIVFERTGTRIHPNDHVNASQSSNDVVPSAVHVAVARSVDTRLLPALAHLAEVLRTRQTDFAMVVKTGRTHLMDAVPVTLGQEFGAMARAVELGEERIRGALHHVMELPLGGTAVGTGLNAPRGFASLVINETARRAALPFVEAHDHFEAQGSRDALVALSAMCRSVAISLYKMANDVRWMASGPVAGLREIELPALQAGSSIMPGKVNPVIAEVVCQVAAQVIGNDAAVAFAGSSGNFELNAMVPVIARNVLESVRLLANTCVDFADRCVSMITVDAASLRERVSISPLFATVLTGRIGYDEARRVAAMTAATGRPVAEVVVAEGLMSRGEATLLLDPLRLALPVSDTPLD